MGVTLIIAVSIALAVLAVDLVTLWLLNLLTDVGMWVTLVFLKRSLCCLLVRLAGGLEDTYLSQ